MERSTYMKLPNKLIFGLLLVGIITMSTSIQLYKINTSTLPSAKTISGTLAFGSVSSESERYVTIGLNIASLGASLTATDYIRIRINWFGSSTMYSELRIRSDGTDLRGTVTTYAGSSVSSSEDTLQPNQWYWFTSLYQYGTIAPYAGGNDSRFITSLRDVFDMRVYGSGSAVLYASKDSEDNIYTVTTANVTVYYTSSTTSTIARIQFTPTMHAYYTYGEGTDDYTVTALAASSSTGFGVTALSALHLSEVFDIDTQELSEFSESNSSGSNTSQNATTTATGWQTQLASAMSAISANLDKTLTLPTISLGLTGLLAPVADILNSLWNDGIAEGFEIIADSVVGVAIALVGSIAYLVDALEGAIKAEIISRLPEMIDWIAARLRTFTSLVTISGNVNIAPYINSFFTDIQSEISLILPGVQRDLSGTLNAATLNIPVSWTFDSGGINKTFHISDILMGASVSLVDPFFSNLGTYRSGFATWYSGRTDGNVEYGDSWPYYALLLIIGAAAYVSPRLAYSLLRTVSGVTLNRDYTKETYETVTDVAYGNSNIKSAIDTAKTVIDDTNDVVKHVTYGNSAIEALVSDSNTIVNDASYGNNAIKTAVDDINTDVDDAAFGLSAIKSAITTLQSFNTGEFNEIIDKLTLALARLNWS